MIPIQGSKDTVNERANPRYHTQKQVIKSANKEYADTKRTDSRIYLKQLRIIDLEYESSKITAKENANKCEQLEECERTVSLQFIIGGFPLRIYVWSKPSLPQ